MAATRPIPFAYATDLLLSSDERFLYANYTARNEIYVFDVLQIREAVEELTDGTDDNLIPPAGIPGVSSPDLSVGNAFCFPTPFIPCYVPPVVTPPAEFIPPNLDDIQEHPIDNLIYPEIDVRAAYKIVDANPLLGRFTFDVESTHSTYTVEVTVDDGAGGISKSHLVLKVDEDSEDRFDFGLPIPQIEPFASMGPSINLSVDEAPIASEPLSLNIEIGDIEGEKIDYSIQWGDGASTSGTVSASGETVNLAVPHIYQPGAGNGPIATGSQVRGLAASSNWLSLDVIPSEIDFEPTVSEIDFEPTVAISYEIPQDKIKEVHLFVSTFPEGQGLFPGEEINVDDGGLPFWWSKEEKIEFLSEEWDGKGIRDFNPQRILTAKWVNLLNLWEYTDAAGVHTFAGEPTNFDAIEALQLTPGQTYHVGVWVFTEKGGSYKISLPYEHKPAADNLRTDAFSSVTVITHGAEIVGGLVDGLIPDILRPENKYIPSSIYDIAHSIADAGGEGAVARYNEDNGRWDVLLKDSTVRDNSLTDEQLLSRYAGKPLVLLPHWAIDKQSIIIDAGFSEAAADEFFAALVNLDQRLMAAMGETGTEIPNLGPLFNSPLHFIGFSRGTIVTSEIAQRILTHFPNAGGEPERDFHVTLLDPHDFDQPSLFNNLIGDTDVFREPKIQIWDGVTYSDIYYQTVPNIQHGNSLIPAGRNIPWHFNPDASKDAPGLIIPRDDNGFPLGEPNLSVFLGGKKESDRRNPATDLDNLPISANSRTGWTPDRHSSPHGIVPAWYGGTVNLNWSTFPSEEGLFGEPSTIHRRKADFGASDLFDFTHHEQVGIHLPWYTSEYRTISDLMAAGDPNIYDDSIGRVTGLDGAPVSWEGIQTGWFYSVLGGGKTHRPNQHNNQRVPLDFDNTYSEWMRGDFPVSSIFNGNFDASHNVEFNLRNKVFSQDLAGWDVYSDSGEKIAATPHLTNLGTLGTPNYALSLGAVGLNDSTPITKIIHNSTYIPDWAQTLVFDLHVTQEQADHLLKLYLQEGDLEVEVGQLRLTRPMDGFGTYLFDIPKAFRGRTSPLKFELVNEGEESETAELRLDNIFFSDRAEWVTNLQIIKEDDDDETEISRLTPTFSWDFDQGTVDPELIEKVQLFASVFPKGEGLLPADVWSPDLLPNTNDDYNWNRTVTATWSKSTNQWYWGPGERLDILTEIEDEGLDNTFKKFTLPIDHILTAGQQYHWTVVAHTLEGQYKWGDAVESHFQTPLPEPSSSQSSGFKSVTILTRGLEQDGTTVDQQFDTIARHITRDIDGDDVDDGLILRLEKDTNRWYWENLGKKRSYSIPDDYNDKPLVLIPSWDPAIKSFNVGFNEGAADILFSSLVQLDQSHNNNGSPMEVPGAGRLFQSPLHFIGFGHGAVINNETIQRLGTYFPNVWGTNENGGSQRLDLQATTIDPHDFTQDTLPKEPKNFQSELDPTIQIWNNISYADNYYQTRAHGMDIPAGRSLDRADWEISLDNKADFAGSEPSHNVHLSALAWYAGTANLSQRNDPLTVYRRTVEIEGMMPPGPQPWYIPDHNRANYDQHPFQIPPWEGTGTGWFHSILGGGGSLDGFRPSRRTTDPRRIDVGEDNSADERLQGDLVVSSVFNGNFDVAPKDLSTHQDSKIAGWFVSSHSPSISHLIDVAPSDTKQPNYAFSLGGTSSSAIKNLTHNWMYIPDWTEAVVFDINVTEPNAHNLLRVSLKQENEESELGAFLLPRKMDGFSTYIFDIPKKFKGKTSQLKFELAGENGSGEINARVLLDNVFFTDKVDWVQNLAVIDDSQSPTQYVGNLTPTFSWNFSDKVNTDDIEKVQLFVSAFDRKEGGVLPTDTWGELPDSNRDYNWNRTITATWVRSPQESTQETKPVGTWHWGLGELADDSNRIGSDDDDSNTIRQFTLPQDHILTAGQQYHWTVVAHTIKGQYKWGMDPFPFEPSNSEASPPAFKSFTTLLPELSTDLSNGFKSVTILTRGLEQDGTTVDSQFEEIAEHITRDINPGDNVPGGLILRLERTTGQWYWLDDDRQRRYHIPDRSQGQPLVLLPGWEQTVEQTGGSAGFNEAAADTIYASLVGLDQTLGGMAGYQNGIFSRTRGRLFQSRFHFIGFGHGAVINDEIIQRLGTDFPDVWGLPPGDGSERLDLQMTTINPPQPDQHNLEPLNLRSVLDPTIQVWENVSFADNYYQTVSDSASTTNNPAGYLLAGADLNVPLDGLADFSAANQNLPLHLQALAWYAGTANLGLRHLPSRSENLIYRRTGDIEALNENDPASVLPWYTPDYRGANFPGSIGTPWEGTATGWFHSVLGGGFANGLRPDLSVEPRVRVSVDNTWEPRIRGDYTIPTLFNGNFDTVNEIDDDDDDDNDRQTVPGWSFYNGPGINNDPPPDLSQSALEEWNNIAPLAKYRDRIGYDPAQSNYALKLESGDTLVHNRFVVPDWGALRFNLFVPSHPTGGRLKVTIKPLDGGIDSISREILMQKANLEGDTYGNKDINEDASRKLGYASNGFETFGFEAFHLQIPLESGLHGNPAQVIFELSGGSGDDLEVYLDDVFFKSTHLRFGIPTPQEGNPNAASRKEARFSNTEFGNNRYRDELLIERPAYALSYNGEANTTNWASWQINRTWLRQKGDPAKVNKRNFKGDTNLPPKFKQVQDRNYYDSTINGVTYVKGHLVPVGDRDTPLSDQRSKDNLAISLLTNIVTQENTHNGNSLWSKIERYTRDFAKKSKNEVYVITGTHGTKQDNNGQDLEVRDERDKKNIIKIKVPKYLWRVLLVLKSPGAEVNENTYTVGFWTENRKPTTEEQKWKQKENWNTSSIIKSVNQIESLTGYDFFPNISSHIQERIEGNRRIVQKGEIPNDFKPILNLQSPLTGQEQVEINDVELLHLSNDSSLVHLGVVVEDTAIRHSGIAKNSQIDINSFTNANMDGIGKISPSQIGSFKNRIFKISTSEIGSPQVSIGEFRSVDVGKTQIDSTQIDSAEIIIEGSETQIGFADIGISQLINIGKIRSFKIGVTQIGKFKIGGIQFSSSQIPIPEVSSFEIGTFQVGTTERSSFEVSTLQISILENSSMKPNITEVSPFQVSIGQIGTIQIGIPENRSSEVDFFENTIPDREYSTTQINSGEIPLASSISLEQLFGSHFSNFHNTLPHINTLLQNTTFKITDLPPGQIAEAQLTQTDPTTGIPIAGTILIDYNANGIGWYIDPTPQDHSEYALPLTEHAFQANPESDAYNRYDLLTAINHELLHLLGAIAGHEPFDQYRQQGKYSFTLDGSHLNSILHPYDLLNPSLQPGQRLLFSEHDLHILEQIYAYNPQKPIY